MWRGGDGDDCGVMAMVGRGGGGGSNKNDPKYVPVNAKNMVACLWIKFPVVIHCGRHALCRLRTSVVS